MEINTVATFNNVVYLAAGDRFGVTIYPDGSTRQAFKKWNGQLVEAMACPDYPSSKDFRGIASRLAKKQNLQLPESFTV